MDTVIPNEVMKYLEELHEEQHDLEGWWRSEDFREETGFGRLKAGRVLREMLREGRVETRRFNLSDAQAKGIGLLGGAGVRFYRFVDRGT